MILQQEKNKQYVTMVKIVDDFLFSKLRENACDFFKMLE